MILISVIVTVISFLVGLAVKFYLEHTESYKRITWPEFFISATIIASILSPIISNFGVKLAVDNQVKFYEFRNGWELNTTVEEVQCYRDGPCYWEYACDPYLVTYSCNCDKNGCQICTRIEYHDCPYCESEYHYNVGTTLGSFRIASNRFPNNPDSRRWRSYVDIPDDIIDRAGQGPPSFWVGAKNRIDAGTPGPVTKIYSYQNYLLRASYSILRDNADNVKFFLDKKLLPEPEREVHDFYWSNKIRFVNVGISNPMLWNKKLDYLNAELGDSLHGDMHVVIVKGVDNPDAYITALKAYWQNPEIFKRHTVSKNSIIVAIGTDDGQTVSWTRAITGMPVGNELLITNLRNEFKNIPLNPDSVLGTVKAHLIRGQITSTDVYGGLAEFVLRTNEFKRVPMEGYQYLKKEIRPSGTGYFLVILVGVVSCVAAWIPAVVIGDHWNQYRRNW